MRSALCGWCNPIYGTLVQDTLYYVHVKFFKGHYVIVRHTQMKALSGNLLVL